jgi:hypothetical protein
MAPEIRFKQPGKVILAGLFPGGGHLILGKWLRAALVFSVLFVILGFAAYAFEKYLTSSTPILSYGLFKQGKLALAVGIPLWLLSIADAVRLASKVQEAKPRGSLLIRWQEFKIALPDLSVAFMFGLALFDYRRSLFPGFEIWPAYVFWGFFEIMALPISPALVGIFMDQRRGPGAKAFAIAVMLFGIGGFSYQMNPLFGVNFALFIAAKAVTFQMGRLSEHDRLHVERRAGMCFVSLFISGLGMMILKAWLSWTEHPLDSPAGDLEMLTMGLIYFLCLAGMNVWWLRRRTRSGNQFEPKRK